MIVVDDFRLCMRIIKYFNFKLESRLGENHPLDSNCESANIQKIYTVQSKRIFQKWVSLSIIGSVSITSSVNKKYLTGVKSKTILFQLHKIHLIFNYKLKYISRI